jgi:ferrous iron transport protein B
VRKTWFRFREFVWVAAPIILVGSMALGALYESGAIWYLERPMEPVVGWWLGLPAVAGLVLIFAFLRKELALQLLVAFSVARYGGAAHDLTLFMSRNQLVVFALVNAIYVPCLATVVMLAHEFGWRRAGYISAGTIATALAVGGAVAHVLPLL